MEPGSLYLRVFLGAKPLVSPELDSLADRMGATRLMSKKPNERYFITKTKCSAMSVGNKLLFGARYYESLTERQRLAVAAHEFGHVLGRDSANRRRRVVVPAAFVSFSGSAGAFLTTRSIPLLELILAAAFLVSAAAFSSLYSSSYQSEEMRSDDLAASFVDGESLLEAIHAAESLIASTKGRFRLGASRHPPTQQRVEAIRAKKPL